MTETSLALALSMLSFMMAVIWGSPLIRLLHHFKVGKLIRLEMQDLHQTKMGTPTMGGVMFILPVVMLTILLNGATVLGVARDVLGQAVLLPVLVMVAYAVLGAVDDWEGVRGSRRGIGMRARTKFILQTLLAVGIAMILKYILMVPEFFWPGFAEPISSGYFLRSICSLYHRQHVECC